jgi:hypothetical protein
MQADLRPAGRALPVRGLDLERARALGLDPDSERGLAQAVHLRPPRLAVRSGRLLVADAASNNIRRPKKVR